MLRSVFASIGSTSFVYDEYGRISEKILPNQVKTTYEYNNADFLVGLTHQDAKGVLDKYQFEYDAMGNKTSINKVRRGLAEESGNYTYSYDALGRLTQVNHNENMLRSYQYDSFGNRTEVYDEVHGRMKYHYNSADRMTKMIDVDAQKVYGYTYDARGNRIAETVNGNIQKQYEFSPMNRLEKVITETGLEKVYTYNGVGQRVGETTGDNQISYVLDMTKKFNNLLQRESNDNVESYTWAGSVLGRQTETSNEFFLQDELGSVTRFMDKKGDILATYGYDEFGNDLSVDIPHYAKQGAYQPFGYTGYRMDTESGLYFAQAREYSSVHGHFVSEDIVRGYVESPITLNHYGYCWGNPVKLVDLDGRWPSWEDVVDYWNKNIYGEEYVEAGKPNVYTKGGNEIGVYWGDKKSKTEMSDKYTGSIIKKTVTTGAENSVSYSINLPSKDLGNGNKVGIPILLRSSQLDIQLT